MVSTVLNLKFRDAWSHMAIISISIHNLFYHPPPFTINAISWGAVMPPSQTMTTLQSSWRSIIIHSSMNPSPTIVPDMEAFQNRPLPHTTFRKISSSSPLLLLDVPTISSTEYFLAFVNFDTFFESLDLEAASPIPSPFSHLLPSQSLESTANTFSNSEDQIIQHYFSDLRL